MAFVQMEGVDFLITQGPEHPDAADPENHLLAKPVVFVPAVQRLGQPPVPLRVLVKVRVQKIDRDREAAHALDIVAARPEAERSALPL